MDQASDRDTHPGEQTGGNRPYFEVLVVEDMSEQQERALRQELQQARRPDDQFVFEILVVPSFDEAVMAARLNFALQACVVCRRFVHKSRQDSSFLAQLTESARPDDLMEHSPDDRAQELARTLARTWADGRQRWRVSSWCKSRSRTRCGSVTRWTTTHC